LRYREWYADAVKYDEQEVIGDVVKEIFEKRFKGLAIEIDEFRKYLNMFIEELTGITGMKCIYHIEVKRPYRRKDIIVNEIIEKIKIIYENNVIDTIVCENKDPNDSAFYNETKYIVNVKLRRILIEIEDKLYIMPLEVKYINIRSL
jgi:predicted phosphatase